MRVQRAAQAELFERMARRMPGLRRNRRGGKSGEGGEGVPVDPNRPSQLSGGAAAALDFGDD